MDEKENFAGGDFFIFSLRMWHKKVQRKGTMHKKQTKRRQ